VEANTTRPATTRIRPLVTGAVVSILGALGIAGITGVITGGMSRTKSDTPPNVLVREPMRTPLPPSKCPLCGTVESIRPLELRVVPQDAEAAGVSGAAAARPIGPEKGSMRTLETVVDSNIGTATEGDEKVKKRFAYRITVRMDDGSYRTLSQPTPSAFAVGDKVRVVEGRLVRA
jgi:outer membrane lipoprotein SlyB